MNQNHQKKSFFSWIPCFCYIYIAFFIYHDMLTFFYGQWGWWRVHPFHLDNQWVKDEGWRVDPLGLKKLWFFGHETVVWRFPSCSFPILYLQLGHISATGFWNFLHGFSSENNRFPSPIPWSFFPHSMGISYWITDRKIYMVNVDYSWLFRLKNLTSAFGCSRFVVFTKQVYYGLN